MATYESLSTADKAVVQNTIQQIRALSGGVGRMFNSLNAIAADTNAINLILSVDAGETIPNESGLAGADDMTRSELASVWNDLTTMKTTHDTAANRGVVEGGGYQFVVRERLTMAAPTEVYVDPSIAGNSGAGTIGDPYGDLQYALDTVTRDSSNGNRFNIKAGTDEVLTATLSTASYGTPSATARLIFQGYTSAAGDGGIGGIDGNATYSVWSSASLDYIWFIDLECHNCGSATVLSFDDKCGVINCYIHNTTGSGIDGDQKFYAENNRIEKVGGFAINGWVDSFILNNYIKHDTNTMSSAVYVNGNQTVTGNIISVEGTEVGINVIADWAVICFNTILSAGGTGKGITCGTISDEMYAFYGNIIEGFSGAGGEGLEMVSQREASNVSYNACYNNTTNYDISNADWIGVETDNETLGASGFDKSGADTYANRLTYFNPVDTGNIIGGAPNGWDKGAVQSAAGGGGGGLSLVNTRRNILIGR